MTGSKHGAALELIEQGWSIIPISPETKRPLIKWTKYQTEIATPHTIETWFNEWPNADLAVVTGAVSGIVVVDTDNPDAEKYAKENGLADTGVTARTKNGRHFYFRHPLDGVRRGPRAGVNVRAVAPDWPAVAGLDFRGDGSYAVLPPSKNYTWESDPDMDEMTMWNDWMPPASAMVEGEFHFEALDLSSVPAADSYVSEWDRTAKYVREKFPHSLQIPSGNGNGRNERVMRYASEMLRIKGLWGPSLRHKCIEFMKEFFVDALEPREFEATVASVEQMERRNHPERFDEKGDYIYKPLMERVEAEVSHGRKLLYVEDAEALIKESEARSYLIEPWLRKGTIVQVYAYSGHGKSMVLQNALYALASGRRSFGPWEMPEGAARVLYLDYENGPGTIGTRLAGLKQLFGDAEDRFAVWTPFLEEGEEMSLRTNEGIAQLSGWVKWYNPDVVVIDTIRSAWSGMSENDASEWGNVNKLAIKLRNAGYAVILVHHSNKPSETGSGGREAGSTNQLTVLETQIRVTQVFEDKETAHQNAGRFDGDYDNPVWPLLKAKLPTDSTLDMVIELRYGKVREWTDLHDRVQWVGWGTNNVTGERYVVNSASTKQRAKNLALEGYTPASIASALHRPTRTVQQWLGLPVPKSTMIPPPVSDE